MRAKRTLFLSTEGYWVMSEPTAVGFRHTRLGNTNNLPTRERAEAEMRRVVRRRQRAKVKA